VADTQYPSLTPDGKTLYFASTRSGDGYYRIFSARRESDGGFGEPVLEHFADDGQAITAVLSADGRTLMMGYAPELGQPVGVRAAVRADTTTPFGPVAVVPELNEANLETIPGWMSPDNCRLYMTSRRLGSFDIYVAERTP